MTLPWQATQGKEVSAALDAILSKQRVIKTKRKETVKKVVPSETFDNGSKCLDYSTQRKSPGSYIVFYSEMKALMQA